MNTREWDRRHSTDLVLLGAIFIFAGLLDVSIELTRKTKREEQTEQIHMLFQLNLMEKQLNQIQVQLTRIEQRPMQQVEPVKCIELEATLTNMVPTNIVQEKMRQGVEKLLQIGEAQYGKGYFGLAAHTLQAAQELQQYLTEAERTRLEKFLRAAQAADPNTDRLRNVPALSTEEITKRNAAYIAAPPGKVKYVDMEAKITGKSTVTVK